MTGEKKPPLSLRGAQLSATVSLGLTFVLVFPLWLFRPRFVEWFASWYCPLSG